MNWYQSPVERLLTLSGFHPSAPWWAQCIDEIRSRNARVCTFRVGRRGGKSVHAIRWALSEALEKHWRIDQGDVGIIPIVSARRWQAEDREAQRPHKLFVPIEGTSDWVDY